MKLPSQDEMEACIMLSRRYADICEAREGVVTKENFNSILLEVGTINGYYLEGELRYLNNEQGYTRLTVKKVERDE